MKKISEILDVVDILHGVKSAEQGSPVEDQLHKLVAVKYGLIVTYIHFGDQIRNLARDGLYGHFNQHLDEEREQLYQLNKKLTARECEGRPSFEEKAWDGVSLGDTKAILQRVQKLELASAAAWSALFKLASKDVPLNGMAQNYAVECQGHADDMARYLRSYT